MPKPRDPSSVSSWRNEDRLGAGIPGPARPSQPAPRPPQGLLSYIEALNRQANDNAPPSAPRHAPMLAQASTSATTPAPTSLNEAHRAESRWPVIDAKDERARRQSILENSPAIFRVGEYPYAPGPRPLHALQQAAKALARQTALGATQVRKHDPLIEEEAKRAGIDPDLLRAIMYMEVSQGGIMATPLNSSTGLIRSFP
jgi:soluble lytic murein transglycosylase-like protein